MGNTASTQKGDEMQNISYGQEKFQNLLHTGPAVIHEKENPMGMAMRHINGFSASGSKSG